MYLHYPFRYLPEMVPSAEIMFQEPSVYSKLGGKSYDAISTQTLHYIIYRVQVQ